MRSSTEQKAYVVLVLGMGGAMAAGTGAVWK
jgi:hypothetical protein